MTLQTLDQWDKRIAPRLSALQSKGNWIAHYAREIQSIVKDLPCRPAWETLARESLNVAEQELMIALAVVRAGRDMYDQSPILIETHQETEHA